MSDKYAENYCDWVKERYRLPKRKSLIMKMELQLDPDLVKGFCEENNCKPYQIKDVLMSFLKKDIESTNYRNIGSSNFDLDSFLISQSPAGLLTLRANALTNKKRIIESSPEPQQKLD